MRRLVAVVTAFGMLASGAVAGSASAGASATPAAERRSNPMSSAERKKIDASARRALARTDGQVPGMWIGIWDPAKGSYTAGYGSATTGGASASRSDHNRIGSVTKTFTGVAVLRLVQRKQLALGDTIAKRLPALAARYPQLAKITVRRLLNMSTGIPDYANSSQFLSAQVADPTKVWSAAELIDFAMTRLTLEPVGTPGYSSTNYVILGEIVAAVTGAPVESAIAAVARRAGLSETALPAPADNALPQPSSAGYLNGPGASDLQSIGVDVAPPPGDITSWSASWGNAAGSMYSTVGDLGRWGASGLGNAQLSPKVRALRLANPTKIDGVGRYGLGIVEFGKGWIGHRGQILGWESEVYFNTRTGAVAVAMVNETSALVVAAPVLLRSFPSLIAAIG